MSYIDRGVEFRIDNRNTEEIDELLPDDLLMEHLILIDVNPELLSLYKNAAISMAEQYMNRPLIITSIMGTTNSNSFRVPYMPFQVDLMDIQRNYIHGDFNDINSYVVADNRNGVMPILFSARCSFDGTPMNKVPQSIIHGLCMLVATMFQNRESVVLGMSAHELKNFSHWAIFDQYRLPNNVGGF